jgi:hypothetical protein
MPQIYNFAPALANYINGASLQDIEKMTGIPIRSLEQVAANQHWAGLRHAYQEEKATSLVPAEDPETVRAIQRVNRDKCRKEVDRLRSVTERWYRKFEDDPTLAPTGKDLRDFACSLATIHDLAYRAALDFQGKNTTGHSDKVQNTQIVVNMPGVMGQPRQTKKVEIVDVPQLPDDTTTGSHNDALTA